MVEFLNLDTHGLLQLSPADMVGKMIGVTGSTGSGKSYTLAVIVEELHPHMPFTIVDTAGEYWTLREKFDVLIAGRFNLNDDGERSDHCDLEITVDDAEQIAEYSFRHRVSVILDLLLFDEDERATLLAAYFKRLWDLVVRKPQPYAVICDEAHNYIPQSGKTAVKRHLVRLAKEGRKFGISFVFATQRPASITKDVITQASMLFLHGVYYATDVATYCDIVPKLKPAAVEALIDQLQTGQAIFVRGKDSQIVAMRSRHTTHAGSTPELNGDHKATLRVIDQNTVEELKAQLVAPPEADVKSSDLQQQNDAQKRTIQAQDKEIATLKAEVEKWKAMVQGESVADAVPAVQLRMDAVPLPEVLAANVEKREQSTQARVVKRQLGTLDRLKLKMARLPNYEKEALFYMSRMPKGKRVKKDEIASKLLINPSKLSMAKLVDTGLVERDSRSKYHMFSWCGEKLGEMFPDLEPQYVLDQIIQFKERTA